MREISLSTFYRESRSKVRFNLKQMREAERMTQIMLVTTIGGRRVRLYTRLRVEPRYWNIALYRCMPEAGVNKRERLRLQEINRRLERLEEMLLEEDERLARRGCRLTRAYIKEVLLASCSEEEKILSPLESLYRLVEEYERGVNRRGKRGTWSTKEAYMTALRRLEEYNRERRVPIASFDDFDKLFFDDFTNFLYRRTYGNAGRHYTQNTVINTLKVIKNLLHRAYDHELTTNNYFLKVQTTLPSTASEQVYLTEEEVARLAVVETENRQEREVRDMFVIACYTALRISDLQQLNSAIIGGGTIALYQTKTKERVEIPVLKEIAPLVAHYVEAGFPRLHKSEANRIVKRLAARCGISQEVMRREHRGGETHVVKQPKHALVSFHTARRSCVTNLYKRGYPPNYIMTLSGHHSLQAFQRYMRATSQEVMTDFLLMLEREQAVERAK